MLKVFVFVFVFTDLGVNELSRKVRFQGMMGKVVEVPDISKRPQFPKFCPVFLNPDSIPK